MAHPPMVGRPSLVDDRRDGWHFLVLGLDKIPAWRVVHNHAGYPACQYVKSCDSREFSVLTDVLGIFILWRFGKESQWTAEAVDRHSLSTFVDKDRDGTIRLAGSQGGESLTITKGLGIFFDKGGIKTPLVFSQFIQKLVSMPEVVIFFHLRPLEYPTVPPDERFVVSKIRYLPNCYRIVVRHGFMVRQSISSPIATIDRLC